MKTLEINGRKLQYEVTTYADYGTRDITKFYEGVETKVRKRYWLFGPEVMVSKPIHIFSVCVNIESLYYSKEEIRDMILKELVPYDKREAQFAQRRKEIKSGELV